jgi:hypothetical protein
MIVRVSGSGQYRLPDSLVGRLDTLDDDAVKAVEAGDEQRFRELFDQMFELVRTEGEPVPPDELIPSDVILPPPDTTFEEAASDFTGEGLVPDPA